MLTKKHLISSILFVILCFSLKPVNSTIQDDINTFNAQTDAPTQVICFYHSDGTTITFSHANFANKADGIAFYQTIATNTATANTLNDLTYNNSLLNPAGSNFSYTAASVLCVVRFINMDPSLPLVPNRTSLDAIPSLKYLFFPSQNGYHPNGGAAIYTHKTRINTAYSAKTARVLVFTAFYYPYYDTHKTTYDALTGTSLRSLWGPYYRYHPNPAKMLTNQYVHFPRIQFNQDNFNLTAGTFNTITYTGANATFLQSFINETMDISALTLHDCNFNTNTIVFLSYKSVTNACSWNTDRMTCVTDHDLGSKTASDTFYTTTSGGSLELNNTSTTSICRDTQNTLWLELK